MVFYVSYFIMDILFSFCIHNFFKRSIGEPLDRKKILLVFAVYTLLDLFFYFLIQNRIIVLLVSIPLLLLCSLAYGRFGWRNFVMPLILFGLTAALEFIAEGVITLLLIGTNQISPDMKLVLGYIFKRLIVFLTLTLVWCVSRNKTQYFPVALNIVGIMGIVLAGIWLACYLYLGRTNVNRELTGVQSIPLMISMAAIVCINIVAFSMFNKQEEHFILQQKNTALKNIVEMQISQYEADVMHRDKLSALKHDMKNYLIGVGTYIKNGDTENALKAIDRNLAELEHTRETSCSGWTAMDTIINFKALCAKNKGINIIVSSRMSRVPKIEPEDLCVLVGNALDNAIEYLEGHPVVEKTISVKFADDIAGICIQIENGVEKNIYIEDGKFIKSTKEGYGHGYGMSAAKRIAEKYNGDIVLECSLNKFSFGAVLHD